MSGWWVVGGGTVILVAVMSLFYWLGIRQGRGDRAESLSLAQRRANRMNQRFDSMSAGMQRLSEEAGVRMNVAANIRRRGRE